MIKRLFNYILLFVFCLGLTASVFGQELFEGATEKEKNKPFELNGYVRGTLFVGKALDKDEAEIKSGYGELSFKVATQKLDFGDAFAEIRFRKGNEFNTDVSEVNVREAYVNLYAGRFDFRIGHQIVVWGRADGLNPTNNITPQNLLVRSPDEDDRREGNFLIRSYYNVHPVRLEAIWIPYFKSSYIPTTLLPLPPGISRVDPDFPDSSLKNSVFALRLNLELASIDGSLSYFNGHYLIPGISGNIPETYTPPLALDVYQKSYRSHVLGADFQTTVGNSFGLRGELAYKKPLGDYLTTAHIPNPDLQYILGIDKEIATNFSLILQYIGRYVFSFEELNNPADPSGIPAFEIAKINRMISSQQNQLSHSFSVRAEQKLLYETMSIEFLGLFYMTTNEFFIKPMLRYEISDAIDFAFGGSFYSGPDDTLFGTIDTLLSAVFTELKISF
ncbi:hypothetical protein ACFLT2_03810 [Acidobacteriota bacterium]